MPEYKAHLVKAHPTIVSSEKMVDMLSEAAFDKYVQEGGRLPSGMEARKTKAVRGPPAAHKQKPGSLQYKKTPPKWIKQKRKHEDSDEDGDNDSTYRPSGSTSSTRTAKRGPYTSTPYTSPVKKLKPNASSSSSSTGGEIPSQPRYSDTPYDFCVYGCYECDFSGVYQTLKYHIRTAHGLTGKDYKTKYNDHVFVDKVWHICKICEKEVLHTYDNLNGHLKSHTVKMEEYITQYLGAKEGDIVAGGRRIGNRAPRFSVKGGADFTVYKCDKCSFMGHPAKFISHMMNVHQTKVDSDTMKASYQFNGQHIGEGTRERFSDVEGDYSTYKCHECNFIGQYRGLMKHIPRHHQMDAFIYKEKHGDFFFIEKVWHTCKICGRNIIYSSRHLYSHLKIHDLGLEEYIGEFLAGNIATEHQETYAGGTLNSCSTNNDDNDDIHQHDVKMEAADSEDDEDEEEDVDGDYDHTGDVLSDSDPTENSRYSDKEGDFCQYGCTECPEFEGVYLAFTDHIAKIHDLTEREYKLKHTRHHFKDRVLHTCKICKKSLLYDQRKLKHHLATHKITVQQYRAGGEALAADPNQYLQQLAVTAAVLPKKEYPPPKTRYSDVPNDYCVYGCHSCDFTGPIHAIKFHLKAVHNMSPTLFKIKYGDYLLTEKVMHTCKICYKDITYDSRNLVIHLKEHGITVEEYYGQYLADGSGDYKLHRQTDQNRDFTTYKCDLCAFVAHSTQFQSHMLSKHNLSVDVNFMKDNYVFDEEQASVEVSERFSDLEGDYASYRCHECPYVGKYRGLIKHIPKHHDMNALEYKDKHTEFLFAERVWHNCKVCGKKMIFTGRTLYDHLKTHQMKLDQYTALYLTPADPSAAPVKQELVHSIFMARPQPPMRPPVPVPVPVMKQEKFSATHFLLSQDIKVEVEGYDSGSDIIPTSLSSSRPALLPAKSETSTTPPSIGPEHADLALSRDIETPENPPIMPENLLKHDSRRPEYKPQEASVRPEIPAATSDLMPETSYFKGPPTNCLSENVAFRSDIPETVEVAASVSEMFSQSMSS